MARRGWIAVLSVALVLAFWATPAAAQGGSNTATLSGVVTDKDGGVIPGATVTVKNVDTAETQSKVTNEAGVYAFPGMNVGSYKVTITMTGFKTSEIDVRLQSARVNEQHHDQARSRRHQRSDRHGPRRQRYLSAPNTPTVTSVINADFIQTLPRSRPQCAELPDLHARRADDWRRGQCAQLHRRRPAAEHDQHHD